MVVCCWFVGCSPCCSVCLWAGRAAHAGLSLAGRLLPELGVVYCTLEDFFCTSLRRHFLGGEFLGLGCLKGDSGAICVSAPFSPPAAPCCGWDLSVPKSAFTKPSWQQGDGQQGRLEPCTRFGAAEGQSRAMRLRPRWRGYKDACIKGIWEQGVCGRNSRL